MRYIDFDGVILDTEGLLFEEWNRLYKDKDLSRSSIIEYIIKSNWDNIINQANIINDSIYLLKQMDPKESAILTKVHSLENEGGAKIRYLRSKNIKQSIILVPYEFKKVEIVSAFNNILIDDNLTNLKEWYESGGYPMFFDFNGTNIDCWGISNDQGYQKVKRIDEKIR